MNIERLSYIENGNDYKRQWKKSCHEPSNKEELKGRGEKAEEEER